MSAIGSGGRVQPARPGDPSRIGPYRIVGRLGAGGMGTVHAGVTSDGMRVAVKVIHPEQAQDPEFRARFRREVELSSRVTGAHLVPLLAADPDSETPWLATAYVPGPTLNQHVTTHGPLTEASLYAFASATARALAEIHAAGVVHRDVKPQNILLTPVGPRVLDFGIAHAADGTSVTRTGVMTGTPGWISPEQYRQGTAGPAGDMFAWGALVAYAATGRLPFGTGAPDVVAFRVMSGEADLDGVPGPLRGIVEKALTQDPGDRPSAAEAAQECTALLAAQVTQVVGADAMPPTAVDMVAAVWDVPAGYDPTWHLPAGRSRSKKQLVGAVVLAAGVIGGLAGGMAALLPGNTGNGRHTASPTTSATPLTSASSGQPSANTASGDTAAKQQTTSGGSATAESWAQTRAAQGAGEHDVARAVLHDEGVLAQDLSDGADFAPKTVRFHESRREIYLSYTLTSDEQGAMYAETEIARNMCLAVRDVALRLHPDLPYRKYVMVKEETGRAPQVTWRDDFVTNTRCQSAADSGTGQDSGAATQDWQPDEDGLGQAMIPSTDSAEIRVADGAARKIIEGTNGMRESLGTDRELGNGQIKVGFDPASSAMYVWSDYLEWNQQQVESWADMAAGEACRSLVSERESAGDAWPYSRYAVAEIGGSGYLMIRWGTATTRADCPS
ncbi:MULTISPECIES: serine/threonine protein kinase [unclassified Streptomyces]|uniref:serine/threonine protein kinase n=1 Tax=unclassified Streptomyces TaxID=2593676 RepID=UPI00093B006A|nr:serine/threonine-protein kinase [Streptomyces sp. TSRI0107]OKJ77333.1 serine/threonine protein kinase [Streptomyces sp. TSRI0107]